MESLAEAHASVGLVILPLIRSDHSSSDIPHIPLLAGGRDQPIVAMKIGVLNSLVSYFVERSPNRPQNDVGGPLEAAIPP